MVELVSSVAYLERKKILTVFDALGLLFYFFIVCVLFLYGVGGGGLWGGGGVMCVCCSVFLKF